VRDDEQEAYWAALEAVREEKYWADREEQAREEAEHRALLAAQEAEQERLDEERYWDRRYAEHAEALARDGGEL
jgi:hypothetical protein